MSNLRNFSKNPMDFYDAPITYSGAKYSPMEHKKIINTLLEGFDKEGIRITSEYYKSNENKTRLIGMYNIDYGSNLEFRHQISFRNSTDGSMSFAIVSGTQVIVCENGMLSGDYIFKRKHMGSSTSDIMILLQNSLEYTEDAMKRNLLLADRMKEVTVDKQITAHLVGELFLNEMIISSSQMNVIKEQLIAPSYDYKAPGTLYETYNHITHSLKSTNPLMFHKKHKDLSDFIETKFDMKIDTPEIIEI